MGACALEIGFVEGALASSTNPTSVGNPRSRVAAARPVRSRGIDTLAPPRPANYWSPRRHFGYRRLRILLRREDWMVNSKRVIGSARKGGFRCERNDGECERVTSDSSYRL